MSKEIIVATEEVTNYMMDCEFDHLLASGDEPKTHMVWSLLVLNHLVLGQDEPHVVLNEDEEYKENVLKFIMKIPLN